MTDDTELGQQHISFLSVLTCPDLLGPQPCDRPSPASGRPGRAAELTPCWCPHFLWRREPSRRSPTPPRGGWWRFHPSAVRQKNIRKHQQLCFLTIHPAVFYTLTAAVPAEPSHQHQTTKCASHQHLEEDHEQLVTGHEVSVENSQVEPAAQTAKHLDEHLLIVPRLLHTRRLKDSRNTSSMRNKAPSLIRLRNVGLLIRLQLTYWTKQNWSINVQTSL